MSSLIARLLRTVRRSAVAPPPPDPLEAGLQRLREGDTEGAERAARVELEARPESAGAAFLLGMVAQARNRPQDAIAQFATALERSPSHFDAALKAALVLRDLGRLDEALKYLDAAVSIRPDAQALNERAIACLQAGRLAQAEADLRRALELAPGAVEVHCNLGIVLRRAGLHEDAARALERAVELGPESVVARCNLAASLRERDRHAEALGHLERALALDPGHLDARTLKGLLLRELGRPEEALGVLGGADAAAPDALCNLGLALQDLGRLDEAAAAFERAAAHGAQAHQAIFNRGMLRLLRGAFEAGWRDYAHRIFTDESPRRDFGAPEWRGERLEGKSILVYAEQGLGDEIMFASCVPDLLAQGGRVALECDPRLAGLFARAFPQAGVIAAARAQGVAQVRAQLLPDFQVAAGSLPGIFRNRAQAFPGTPYLRADPARVGRWREWLRATGAGPRVGLAWRGGIARTRSASRTVPVAQLGPLLAAAPVHFVGLQHDATGEELARLARDAPGRFTHPPGALQDIEELAALVCALEGVVSVCQTLVHLCGALGRPCWVLAPHVPEWRYGLEPGAMRWYGSVRVLHQAQPGDWTHPLEAAATELAALAGAEPRA